MGSQKAGHDLATKQQLQIMRGRMEHKWNLKIKTTLAFPSILTCAVWGCVFAAIHSRQSTFIPKAIQLCNLNGGVVWYVNYNSIRLLKQSIFSKDRILAFPSLVYPPSDLYPQEPRPTLRKMFSSVQFSHSVVSDSLRPHESQHARPPCPSPTGSSIPSTMSQLCFDSEACNMMPRKTNNSFSLYFQHQVS